MPELPSGLKLYISNDMILEPNNNFFNCPEGNFWYQTPDLAINKPPFEPGTTIIQDFVHAPVPKSREEVKRYIKVLIGLEGNHYYWRGDTLSDLSRPGELDDADLEVWIEWLESDSTREFLDESIEKCRVQAEANRRNTGWVSTIRETHDDVQSTEENRLREIGKRTGVFERAANEARAASNQEKALEVYSELETLLEECLAIRRRLGCEGEIGAYVEGYLNRVLHRWSTAEKLFRENLRSNPFHLDAWLELTWCLSEQGDLAEAEVAARRAVKVGPDEAAAWGNLAATLIQLGQRNEAKRALDRALELDPDDSKNLHLERNFENLLSVADSAIDEDQLSTVEIEN